MLSLQASFSTKCAPDAILVPFWCRLGAVCAAPGANHFGAILDPSCGAEAAPSTIHFGAILDLSWGAWPAPINPNMVISEAWGGG